MHLRDVRFQAMAPSPAFKPDDLEAFVSAPRIATLAYAKRDGMPTQFPIWYRYEDGRFHMVTSATSAKAKALARTGRACLTIKDDMPPYRAVVIDGDVTFSETPVEGGLNRWLAVHYFGRLAGAQYEKMAIEEYSKSGLTKITIDPTRVRGFDNHQMIPAHLRFYQRMRESLPLLRRFM